ncbi:MAG: hypothetical protein JW864_04430 [Spirochaetes bacterium]|nr:hypothetical protein [Spirochaetota bacterium]
MNKRRIILIDKKYQLKTAFSIVGITTILAVVILLAISSILIYNNQRVHGIMKVEDNIFQAMSVIGSQGRSNSEAISEMSRDHINNFNITDDIIKYNNILLISLLVFIIIQGVIIYLLMIKKTHRISGPIYVISNYFKDLIAGKYPDPRPLRKNDELGDFYELFIQLVSALKERDKNKK